MGNKILRVKLKYSIKEISLALTSSENEVAVLHDIKLNLQLYKDSINKVYIGDDSNHTTLALLVIEKDRLDVFKEILPVVDFNVVLPYGEYNFLLSLMHSNDVKVDDYLKLVVEHFTKENVPFDRWCGKELDGLPFTNVEFELLRTSSPYYNELLNLSNKVIPFDDCRMYFNTMLNGENGFTSIVELRNYLNKNTNGINIMDKNKIDEMKNNFTKLVSVMLNEDFEYFYSSKMIIPDQLFNKLYSRVEVLELSKDLIKNITKRGNKI